ncbi:hypothetical protein Clacol_005973 [Clathrus columnatus]|uniref:Uncharacterized protein n=1 Tax=Clathrus columnatus TaxID=1419009 RepID=A0AAV5AFQ8_9AGAM|nr:hypothetical protein Clacol_005973 [Clathrus columnatus]
MPLNGGFKRDESLLAYLSVYPFAAFIVDARSKAGKADMHLHPIYGNTAYLRLIHGPSTAAIASSSVPTNMALLGGLVDALADVGEARRLAAWTQMPRENQDGVWKPPSRAECSMVLTFRPPWLPPGEPPLRKEVIKTFMDGFWLCTTVPRTDFPARTPSPTTTSSIQARRTNSRLRIINFPPPSAFPRLLTSAQGTQDMKSDPLGSSHSPNALVNGTHPTEPIPHRKTFSGSDSNVLQSLSFDPLHLFDPATAFSPPKYPGEMERMVQDFPWESTDLGPITSWNQSLKTAISICLQSPTSCTLLWGPSLVLIYNDKYADMAGKKHPKLFGKSGSDAWGEVWDRFGPVSVPVLKGRSAARQDGVLPFVELMTFDVLRPANIGRLARRSLPDVELDPCKGRERDGGGNIELVNWFGNNSPSLQKTTQKVIAERRLLSMRTFSERAKLSKDVLQLTHALISVLERNKEERRESSNSNGTPPFIRTASDLHHPPLHLSLKLAGSIGVPDAHPATPLFLELALDPVTYRPHVNTSRAAPDPDPDMPSQNTTDYTFAPDENHYLPTTASQTPWRWPIAEAIVSRRPLLVPSLPEEVVEGLSRRSWGDVPRQAVIIPIWSHESEETPLPQAILILGINPRRPYDKQYEEWIHLFSTALSVSLAAVLSWEAETQRAEQLAQLDAAKTSFFSSVSHELRTPLTLIMGPLHDALDATRDPNVKDMLSMASRNVSRLSRLVDSLMDFTRIEAGKLLGNFKPVHLGSFTADLAALFRSTIEKSHIQVRPAVFNDTILIVDLSSLSLIVIQRHTCYAMLIQTTYDLCFTSLWEKIVFNLIGNAFKYTLEGSIKVQLYFGNQEILFSVIDTGVGIPEEDLDKVFQRFHRVSSVSRSHEGTGIGLSLTKELVRLHGGTISVSSKTRIESRDGSHGSIFTVRLPLGKDHLPPSHVQDSMSEEHRHQHYARGVVEEATHWSDPSEQRNEMTRTPVSSVEGSERSEMITEGIKLDHSTLFFVRKDILLLVRLVSIVDDSSDMRQFIRSMFVELCTVVEATNGQVALDLMDKGLRPNLVLTDIMMPFVDGFALLKAMRERPHTTRLIESELVPIIFLTAKAGEESRVDGLLSGADDYIAKPFQGRELVARVHLQMQLGKRRAELEARFEERQREIQILSDNSPIGIVRTDPNGSIIYSNPRWDELTGRAGKPLNTWIESVQPDDVDAVVAVWSKALDERVGGSVEFREQTVASRGLFLLTIIIGWLNGVWTKGQVVPLGAEHNEWAGILFTITDISDQRLYEAAQLLHAQEREATARKRAEEAEESRREADERRRAQELLIDVTSHELRQPVSAILNCSTLVKENLSQMRERLQQARITNTGFIPEEDVIATMDEDLEALDSIYQCGLAQGHAERIANDVLSLSRIQLQVLSIYPVEFELVPEIRRVVAIFHNELKMKRIRLDLIFGDSLRRLHVRRIRSDKSRLGQVLTNLLSNAIKFVDTSVDRREISVSVDVSFNPPQEGSCLPPLEDQIPDDPAAPIYLYIAVKDSGPGLHPDDLALLFKRFQQGSNSHDVFGGSGLGLFVSRKLCDLMNGRIDVDSVFGEGATFRFFIQTINSPVGPDSLEASDLSVYNNTFVDVSHENINTPLHSNKNSLLNTRGHRQLKGAGFSTTLAANGQQALDSIKQLSDEGKIFNAILMDCEMPVMDGLTAVREIRRLEMSGTIKGKNNIFALTGNARAGQVESAMSAGMDDVVVRCFVCPFPPAWCLRSRKKLD